MKKRSSGGELLTPYHRHQRDMFSGDLGIPEISSHVGSVVHTFETMALQREITERQRAQRKREHSEYLLEVANSNESTPTSYNRGVLTFNGTSNKKLQQLKKKSHDSRQKLIQHILLHQEHLQRSSSLYQKQLSVNFKHKNIHDSIHSSTSNSEVYYKNIDNDYRKNYICNAKTHLPETESHSQQSEASQIVTKAFEEVLANYGDLEEDEEECEDLETRRVEKFRESETGRKFEQFKKPFSLPPKDNITSSGHSSINISKHKSLPFNQFIKCLKSSSPSTKLISTSVAKMDHRGPIENTDHIPRVAPPSGHLLREVEGGERDDKQKQNFLRGSTLSQSFVHQLHVHKPHQKPQAPPIPLTKLTTSQALRQILLFPKRLKHSVECLPEDGDAMNRKHYGKLEENQENGRK
uniref:Uncharacterized protein n=1 Tax=Glossina pallidipes TaxID=7398 RepID=A0A1B0AC70_GLOPL